MFRLTVREGHLDAAASISRADLRVRSEKNDKEEILLLVTMTKESSRQSDKEDVMERKKQDRTTTASSRHASCRELGAYSNPVWLSQHASVVWESEVSEL
ncbi:hypothetical protein Bbelb_223020 [Branchiostoma belcheri]|nr:hypothetical protein Bbelb_223020 [Branchiostoma belcheri]